MADFLKVLSLIAWESNKNKFIYNYHEKLFHRTLILYIDLLSKPVDLFKTNLENMKPSTKYFFWFI